MVLPLHSELLLQGRLAPVGTHRQQQCGVGELLLLEGAAVLLQAELAEQGCEVRHGTWGWWLASVPPGGRVRSASSGHSRVQILRLGQTVLDANMLDFEHSA